MMGGLLSSLFILPTAGADTVILKNDKELKGLVVEEAADRIFLSTEKGELPILLSGIKDIRYDEPEQNFMQMGRAYEAEKKYGEALAYYEKALETNPQFEEAKRAAMAMKSRFWASTMEGPQSEMEKQQAIADSRGEGLSSESSIKKGVVRDEKILRENLGLVLSKKGDWVHVREAHLKKDAFLAGLRPGDSLIKIDTDSLRFLGIQTVAKKIIYPRYSSFTLEYERDCPLQKDADGLGLKLKLDARGISAEKVLKNGPAALAGIQEGDVVAGIDGRSTRYMPLDKVMKIMNEAGRGRVTLSIRRWALLTRR